MGGVRLAWGSRAISEEPFPAGLRRPHPWLLRRNGKIKRRETGTRLERNALNDDIRSIHSWALKYFCSMGTLFLEPCGSGTIMAPGRESYTASTLLLARSCCVS